MVVRDCKACGGLEESGGHKAACLRREHVYQHSTVSGAVARVQMEYRRELEGYAVHAYNAEGGTLRHAITRSRSTAGSVYRDWLREILGGRYDVPCSTCKGARVEAVVDRERANPELLARLDAERRAEAEFRAQERAERRMGA